MCFLADYIVTELWQVVPGFVGCFLKFLSSRSGLAWGKQTDGSDSSLAWAVLDSPAFPVEERTWKERFRIIERKVSFQKAMDVAEVWHDDSKREQTVLEVLLFPGAGRESFRRSTPRDGVKARDA